LKGERMENRFKYAFWHRRKREMWEVRSIDLDSKEVSNGGDIANLDEGDLIRSTGLIDKIGQLIYEGDYIKLKCGSNEIICPVVWDDNESQFNLKHPKGYHGRFGFNSRIIDSCDLFEIIGNKFCNPELLEVKDE